MQSSIFITTLLCSLQFGSTFVNQQQGRNLIRRVVSHSTQSVSRSRTQSLHSTPLIIIFEDDDDDSMNRTNLIESYDDEDEEDADAVQEDPYQKVATSEFLDSGRGGGLVTSTGQVATGIDWGGALGKLRDRVGDIESGKSQDPSHALFRLMSSQSPNQAIGSFVQSANPQVVQAMSGAVGSLLGGLSSPQSGIEMIVKASGEKIGSLCFQLQMTGYLFR